MLKVRRWVAFVSDALGAFRKDSHKICCLRPRNFRRPATNRRIPRRNRALVSLDPFGMFLDLFNHEENPRENGKPTK